MFTLDFDKLTPEQWAMVALWEAHLKAEMQDRDAHTSCDTVVDNPYVNHVAVLTGGFGRRQLENYYSRYFIPGQPPDLEIVPISPTVGQERIVDEFVYRGTPSIAIEGGWRGYNHVALEPTHAPFDSLVDAAEAKACPILKPRGVATWRIELELNCDC